MIKKALQKLFNPKKEETEPIPEISNAPPLKAVPTFFDVSSPFKSGSLEEYLESLVKNMPELEPLFETKTDEDLQKRLLEMPLELQSRVFMILVTVTFQSSKFGRHEDALRYSQALLIVVDHYAPDTVKLFFGNTQPRNRADILQQTGGIYEDMGNFSQALGYCLEADQMHEADRLLCEKHGITGPSEFDRLFKNESMRGNLCAQIAGIYKKLNNREAAQKYYQLASQYAQGYESDITDLRFIMGNGDAAFQEGDFDKALKNYHMGMDLAIRLSQSSITTVEVVGAASSIGDIYLHLELYHSALKYFNKCLELNRNLNNHGRMFRDFQKIAWVNIGLKRYEAATKNYQEALKYVSVPADPTDSSSQKGFWEFEGQTYRIANPHDAWRILYQLAGIEDEQQKPEQALPYLKQAIEVIETIRGNIYDEAGRIGYQTELVQVYDRIIDLLAGLWKINQTKEYSDMLFEYIEKAKSRILLEQIAEHPLIFKPNVPEAWIVRENELLSEINLLETRLTREYDQFTLLAKELDEKEMELLVIWQKIAQEDPVNGPEYLSLRREMGLSLMDAEAILSQCGPNVAAIEYYCTDKALITFVLFSNGHTPIVAQQPHTKTTLRTLVAVDAEKPPAIDLRLPFWEMDLPVILLNPIRSVFDMSETVYFIPHDILHKVPFQILPLSGTANLTVVDKTVPMYIPSLSLLQFNLLKKRKLDMNTIKALVMGNPIRSDMAAIPATEAEALAVGQYLKAIPLLLDQASKSNLLASFSTSDIIHIACHGKFDSQDAYQSALLLSDSNLTAEEIMGMQTDAQLVVLSACETGISQNLAGDEQFGLLRALLYAGASSIIVSLWNSYDKFTQELMLEFYKNLIVEQDPAGLALAKAQRKAHQDGVSAMKWGPFIIIGI